MQNHLKRGTAGNRHEVLNGPQREKSADSLAALCTDPKMSQKLFYSWLAAPIYTVKTN